MRVRSAKKAFKRFASDAGQSLDAEPLVLVRLMASFYVDVRAKDVEIDDDGDMLLLEWGVDDWGEGEALEYGITRQLIRPRGDDHEIWQLRLTGRAAPTPAMRALPAGERWCHRPSEAEHLVAFAADHPATSLASAAPDLRWTLEFEDAC